MGKKRADGPSSALVVLVTLAAVLFVYFFVVVDVSVYTFATAVRRLYILIEFIELLPTLVVAFVLASCHSLCTDLGRKVFTLQG